MNFTAGGALRTSLAEASLSALSLVAPDVLPNIDRLADLEHAMRETLANIPVPLAIVGDGGYGKSVMLRQIHERIVGDDKDLSQPLLVLCSRVPASADLSSAEAVDTALGATAVGSPDPGSVRLTELLDEVAAQRSMVLLLDTVDLILNDTNVAGVVHVLRQVAARTHLIFTCRDVEYHNLLDGEDGLVRKVYEVPRLDPKSVALWARAYTEESNLEESRRETFVESLTTPAAAGVCATPLRLAMACEIYAPAGIIPEDLTVTRLYDQYWKKRVASDRHGKKTNVGRAQEVVLEAVAEEIWNLSDHQFAIEASGRLVKDHAALQRVCSEGVLKDLGGRYQFFHQTYAEYAVARWLKRVGSPKDFDRLWAGLHRDGAVLWQVAQYIVTLDMSDNRYDQISRGVPITKPRGLRTLFIGAFHRRDASRVLKLGRSAESHLMRAGVSILADAPAECLSSAAEVAVLCLEASTDDDIEKIGTACARIYATLPESDRPQYLRRTVDATLRRQRFVSDEAPSSVLRRLIDRTKSTQPDDHVVNVLIDFYATETGPELPAAGQSAVLELADAHPPNHSTQVRLLLIATKRECPSGAVPAVTRLLTRAWQSREFRDSLGWPDIHAMLEDDLPPRWDACQVRLGEALCHDVETAHDVLAIAFSDAELRRDRWTDLAKFIADLHREVVLSSILGLPKDLQKPAVGTVCSVVNRMADSLSAEQRLQVAAPLEWWIETDSRRVWATRVRVSVDDISELRDCAVRLASLRVSERPNVEATINSAYDTFLNACTPAQLVELQPELCALMSRDRKRDRERLARLDGLVALDDPSVRRRTANQMHDAATNAAYAAARGLTTALSCSNGAVDAATSEWLYGLLESPHSGVVRLVAEALHTSWTRTVVPESASTTVSRRLIRSLHDHDDPQTPRALVNLLIDLEQSERLDGQTRDAIVARLRQGVIELLAFDSTDQRRRDHLPALFNLHKESLTALVIPHCSADEVIALVERTLDDFDTAQIAKRSRRPLAHLLLTAARHTDAVLPLLERKWPETSDSNRAAIVECVTHVEKDTPGVRSTRLARREDCPVALQNLIYELFPG